MALAPSGGAAWVGVAVCLALLGCQATSATPGATAFAAATATPSLATLAATATPTRVPTPTATPSRAPRRLGPVALQPALGGRRWDRPVELGGYPSGRVFVADQAGLVVTLLPDGTGVATLLDLREKVSRASNEEGLLSVALDPAFGANGYVYAYYSVADGPRRTRLARFIVRADTVNTADELVILEVPQPFPNHKGGAIRFGLDGMLFLGLGDGGGAGDPQGNGQNTNTLLGKIIRLDVRGATPGQPYTVPTDNPFARGGGRPEVWAYGLRNPWRMGFDSVSGALWAADVGQNAQEEVDVITRGGNYGWRRMEGERCFRPSTGCEDAGLTMPVAVYGRGDGCSVSGAAIYRGPAVPALTGAFVFSDFCSGTVWAIDADAPAGQIVIATSAGASVSSVNQDADGEVYLLRFDAAVLKAVRAG